MHYRRDLDYIFILALLAATLFFPRLGNAKEDPQIGKAAISGKTASAGGLNPACHKESI